MTQEAAPDSLPRLLAGLPPDHRVVGLARHVEQWGPCWPAVKDPGALVDMVGRSGLRGRGGAWFPAGRKWQTVAREGRRTAVVANGAEGEPASRRDRLLLLRLPHLVLDGVELAAFGVHARRVVLYVKEELTGPLSAALRDREEAGIARAQVELAVAPCAYLAGEESAVVSHLNGRIPARPTFTGVQPIYRRGLSGYPTLVHNVETLAHVALVARFGPAWFREIGTERSPGSALLSVSGAVARPGVVEVAQGARLGGVLDTCGGPAEPLEGVLLGGYGGAFVSGADLLELRLDEEHLRPRGASLGAGVLVAIPASRCPLAITARLVRYLERERAGQCGPCVHGLAELATATEHLAFSRPRRQEVNWIASLCHLVAGRGACHHPDGAAQLVRSALSAFAKDVAHHVAAGPCGRRGPGDLLSLPGSRPGPAVAKSSR
ncbi:MAG: SLBB domain-containing protein [Acidimicrobiales bacterium]|nr:SLBB domain-containing protein [Acidimicrobiales bacterium]